MTVLSEKKMRVKKSLTMLLLVCVLLFTGIVPAFAADAPKIRAESFLLADMDSGNILYEKNMNQMRSPASLTKIMTGLLAAEAVERGDISLDDVITAPSNCWDGMDLDSSNAEILPGEKMTFKDYFYCAMVKSANEACNVLAVALDGSIQAFVNRMNLRANELGATHTFFSDTNGLSNENHYTTAHDLFLITLEAMKHELFAEAVDTIDYEIEETNMHAKRYLNSSNALLCQDGIYGDGYLYLPASGVKTGYTKTAGYCLVSTAEKNDMRLLAVVLGCGGVSNTGEDGYGNFSATIKLYDWGFANFERKTMASVGKVMNRAPVKYASNRVTAELRPAGNVSFLVPKDLDESRLSVDISTDAAKLVAPIAAGTVLGKAVIRIDGEQYASVKLYTADPIEADRRELLRAKAAELLSDPKVKIAVIAVLLLIVLFLFIVIRYYAAKKRRLVEIAGLEAKRRKEREISENIEKSIMEQRKMEEFRDNLKKSE